MSRDFQGHEKKKPKKDLKKTATPSPSSASQPVEVEVVRKHRKKNEDFG